MKRKNCYSDCPSHLLLVQSCPQSMFYHMPIMSALKANWYIICADTHDQCPGGRIEVRLECPIYVSAGAAWPTGTPGDFPVGPQKIVACGPQNKQLLLSC